MSTAVIMMIDICLCDDIWRRIRWDWASGGHGTADLALRTENRKWEMESTESASDSRGVSPRPIGPSWIWLIFEMWEGSILGISDCRFNFSLPGNESISGWGRVEGEGGARFECADCCYRLKQMWQRWSGVDADDGFIHPLLPCWLISLAFQHAPIPNELFSGSNALFVGFFFISLSLFSIDLVAINFAGLFNLNSSGCCFFFFPSCCRLGRFCHDGARLGCYRWISILV